MVIADQLDLFDGLPAELTQIPRSGSLSAVADSPTSDSAVVPDGPGLLPPPAFTIIAYGTPGPQGSKSFRGMSGRGHAILVESSKKVKPWRAVVAAAALAVIECCGDPDCGEFKPGFPLDGPLVGRVVFTLNKPKSRPKTRTTYPDTYPDVSKLLRSTEDALSKIAWADDARIVDYTRLGKVFPGEDPESLPAPGVWLSVWRRGDLP